MNQAVPIYVLSLVTAPERRAAMARHLGGMGLAHELIDGVDGRLMAEEERASLLKPGVTLRAGEVGCYLSHAKAWRRIADGPAQMGLVLEDDARLAESIVPLLREGLRPCDFDYLFLDVDDHNYATLIAYDAATRCDIGHGHQSYALSGGGEGAHAYVITREEARRRLEHGFPIPHAADVYDILAYPIRFRALINRKGAYLSGDSLASLTSARDDRVDGVSFKRLRRWELFYWLRDTLNGRNRRMKRDIEALIRAGGLPPGKDWRAMPSGRRLHFD